MTFELRPYQREAINALHLYWQGGGGNGLLSLPTGSGKSLIIAALCKEMLEDYPTMRIAIATHVRELIAQDYRELLALWPEAPVGIYSAGIGRRDRDAKILFMGVQSIWRKVHEIGPVDLLIIDEAHLVSHNKQTTYRKMIDELRTVTPDMRIAGLTATPFRLDSGRLDTGRDKIFDDVVYDASVKKLINDGYLCKLISKRMATEMNVDNVKKQGGEFITKELEIAVDQDWITRPACQEMIEYGGHGKRNFWLVFCVTVGHANHVVETLREMKVDTHAVFGRTSKELRDRIIAEFRAGEFTCLVSVMVLGTGFNVPHVDMISLMRPTASGGLFVQQVGRGLRNAEGKDNCIAAGQRVLTDHGLVPIECVTRTMKVWDGVDFVPHCGAVFRGEQEVITYAGLTATPDHKVWTEEGWKAIGQCAIEQTPVSVAEIGGKEIRTAEGCYRRGHQGKEIRQALLAGRMLDLWCALSEGVHELAETYGWMSGLWASSTGAKMACHAGNLSQAALYKSKRSGLRVLRWTWDQVSLFFPNSNGSLGAGNSWIAQRYGIRQNKLQWTLQTGKPQISHTKTECGQYQKWSGDNISFISSKAPGDSLRRRDSKTAPVGRSYSEASSGKVLAAFQQAKRPVWDILNAGPRHSFVVEGLLVHNCLILDFAGNTRRHGAVDQVKGKTIGMHDTTKVCPECKSIIDIKDQKCPDCGHMFQVIAKAMGNGAAPTMPNATADGDTDIISSDDPHWVEVRTIRYSKHAKYGDPTAPNTLRVDYGCGFFRHSEWVCFDHEGYAQEKAFRWWKKRASTPSPMSVDEALQRQGELAEPLRIMVRQEGKFSRILNVELQKVLDLG